MQPECPLEAVPVVRASGARFQPSFLSVLDVKTLLAALWGLDYRQVGKLMRRIHFFWT